jgi:hypothetical protein
MDTLVTADYVGFIGTAILLLAFTRAALRDTYLGSKSFLVLNLVGSCLLLVPDYVLQSYQAFRLGASGLRSRYSVSSIAWSLAGGRCALTLLCSSSQLSCCFGTISLRFDLVPSHRLSFH